MSHKFNFSGDALGIAVKIRSEFKEGTVTRQQAMKIGVDRGLLVFVENTYQIAPKIATSKAIVQRFVFSNGKLSIRKDNAPIVQRFSFVNGAMSIALN